MALFAGLLAAGAVGLGSSLCLMASMGACVGYFAGGLGGSTLTHLDWNERPARAGAFLGGALQALGIAGAWMLPYVSAGLAAEVYAGAGVTWGNIVTGVSLVASLVQGDMNGLAYGFLKDIWLPPLTPWAAYLPPALLAIPLNAIFDEYERRL